MKNSLLFLLLFVLIASSVQSFAVERSLPKKHVLVSVGDLNDNDDVLWKKETCEQVYAISNQIADNGTDITCRNFDTNNFHDKGLSLLQGKFDYQMRIMKEKDGSVSIDVANQKRIHESDFKTLGWNFKDGITTKISKEEAMAKTIGNFFFYATNETAFKAGLLVNGAAESNEIIYDQKTGQFKDRVTEMPISINRAYSLYENESDRKKNYLRTGVEIGVLLSSAMAIYYKNLVFNQVDFDYGFKEGIKKKFSGEAIRFDDNDKMSNYGHVYAGVLYYQMARSNGFNSLESFLISYASSTAWEFMEYHEVLSINDQILTPIGGYIIGEATYQISCALFQKNSIAATALGYTINPGMAVNNGINKLQKKDLQPDCKKPRWSDISMYIGLDKGQKAYEAKPGTNTVVGMDATVVNIADYGKTGSSSKLVYDTAMAKMLVELNGNDGVKDLRVIAQIVTAAYHQKNLGKDEKGQLRGYDLILGVGSASTWNDRGTEEGSPNEDFYGTINILGATAHANVHYNGFNIKADFGFYGDFAMVKSYSLNKYEAGNPGVLEGHATTVSKKGYYWGMGTTTLAAIAIEKGKWEVGYNGQFSNAKSIDGHHRKQEEITNHDVFKDTLMTNKVYISYKLTKNLKLKISREYNLRQGSVGGGFNTKGTEIRTMGTLVYQF
ncbi:MAG: DUF3943 domain-containing protein [Bacteriovorax sp.]|jgi:hypothetical protein